MKHNEYGYNSQTMRNVIFVKYLLYVKYFELSFDPLIDKIRLREIEISAFKLNVTACNFLYVSFQCYRIGKST